jgi:hypothetical protein
MKAGSIPSSRAFDDAAMRIEPPVHLLSMPTRVDTSHHFSHPPTKCAALLGHWKILATLLASATPHTVSMLPSLRTSEISTKCANGADLRILTGSNTDARRKNWNLFCTLITKDEITTVRGNLNRRSDHTSCIRAARPNSTREQRKRFLAKF